MGIEKKKDEHLMLSPLSRQCKKPMISSWMLNYYLEGIFSWQKRDKCLRVIQKILS